MIIDKNELTIGRTICLGLPFVRAPCAGNINGTNKAFVSSVFPFYPAAHNNTIPIKDDITVEVFKGTTFTVAPIDKLNTQLNEILNAQIYNGFDITTAPAEAEVDGVVVSGYEEVWARVAQEIAPDISGDSEEIPECGNDDTITLYGKKKRKFKVELKAALGTLQMLRQIHRIEKADQTGVPEGYKIYTERDAPIPIKAYSPLIYNGVEVSRDLLKDVTVDPDSISIPHKAGEASNSVTMNLNIGSAIEELVHESAFS